MGIRMDKEDLVDQTNSLRVALVKKNRLYPDHQIALFETLWSGLKARPLQSP